MGYVNDAHLSVPIPIDTFQMSAGTWTISESSGVVSRARAQADASFNCLIPIKMPIMSSIALQGLKLKSITVWYKIATAAADDFATVELEKAALPADGAAMAGAAVACTIDADHDSAAERKAADEHTITVSLDTPVFVDDDDVFWLKLVVDCAATTDFIFYGARANFNLNL